FKGRMLSLALLGSILAVTLLAVSDDWLGDAVESELALFLTVTSVIALMLVFARPVSRGVRRLFARLWLGWLRSGCRDDSPHAEVLSGLVGCRMELSTALPITDAQLDAIARQVAAAPLPARDVDAVLAHIEHVRPKLHHLERDW